MQEAVRSKEGLGKVQDVVECFFLLLLCSSCFLRALKQNRAYAKSIQWNPLELWSIKIQKFLNRTSRKQNPQGVCFMNEQRLNS